MTTICIPIDSHVFKCVLIYIDYLGSRFVHELVQTCVYGDLYVRVRRPSTNIVTIASSTIICVRQTARTIQGHPKTSTVWVCVLFGVLFWLLLDADVLRGLLARSLLVILMIVSLLVWIIRLTPRLPGEPSLPLVGSIRIGVMVTGVFRMSCTVPLCRVAEQRVYS